MRRKLEILASHDASINALLQWYATETKKKYKICPICKMPFVTSSWKGDLCIFCAKVKQFKNYRLIAYPVRQCDECGRTYQPYSSRSKYCSAICYNKNYFMKKNVRDVCVICGRVYRKRAKIQKCCSTSCLSKAKARIKLHQGG